MKIWNLVCILTSLVMKLNAQPFDEILDINVDHIFVAVDFTYIDDSQWFPITTLANQFVKDTILLVSIPQTTGSFPAVVKMKQPTTLNADKTVSFSMKIVQPNDSFCSKQWYVPKPLAPLQVAWMVFELGSYTVNGFQFIAGKGAMTRASWSTSATFTNGNLISVWFPTGCTTATDYCVLSATDRGAINLLQTNNNVKEAGKDLYISVRAKIIDQRRGQWVLVPHDVNNTLYPNYHVLTEETLGYLAYQVGVKIECFEKMVWETAKQTSVNYVPRNITYQNLYDYPPGLFGIVGTILSLCDTILKSSNWQTTGASFAILEDQCVKEEIKHTSPETVYMVVVGEKKSTTSTYQCYVNFNSAVDPSPAPTIYPTRSPTSKPSTLPTFIPSAKPTFSPSRAPTFTPSRAPTFTPSRAPTFTPSTSPTFTPSTAPTFTPSRAPTFTPSTAPTFTPSRAPTFTPSFRPSSSPTRSPTSSPSVAPTTGTTAAPTNLCSNSFPIEMYRE